MRGGRQRRQDHLDAHHQGASTLMSADEFDCHQYHTSERFRGGTHQADHHLPTMRLLLSARGAKSAVARDDDQQAELDPSARGASW